MTVTMRCLAVVCSLLVVCSAAVPKEVKNLEPSSPVAETEKEVETFHCSPNSNVAVINGKTLRIYECGHHDKSFVLATEGHPQPHLDVTLDREAVNSLSDVYIKRTGLKPVHRQKRQFGGFGGGFSSANANAGAVSGGGGFGPTLFSPYPIGGGGGGFSHAGSSAQAGSFGSGFGGGFGR